jgi:hypothetical protein
MGEGGCPSRVEVIAWGHWLSPNHALTVKEYMGAGLKSQENTLRNHIIILLFHIIIGIHIPGAEHAACPPLQHQPA